jgi:Rrf2 family nitric oxide-sensitive transcriptional repressor
MRLTIHSDYAFRTLTYLGLAPDRECTLEEIAGAYSISKNHLARIAQRLRDAGFIETLRGRTGGVRLARKPHEINLGRVMRATEENLNLVECFDTEHNTCIIAGSCRLTKILGSALDAYLSVLDRYTLADVLHARTPQLTRLLRPAASDIIQLRPIQLRTARR